MSETPAQTARQAARSRGRYAAMNRCELCDKALGDYNYYSHGYGGSPECPGAIVLCRKCGTILDPLPPAEAWARIETAQRARSEGERRAAASGTTEEKGKTMLTYMICENQETGRYYVSAAVGALPVHWHSESEYDDVEQAKAAHPHDWEEPDAECSPDVLAIAVETTR